MKTEWWYYSGQLIEGARRFGFCVAFFRSRTAREDVPASWRPVVRLFAPPDYYPAHFSLTDLQRREFRYAHRRSIRGCAGAATDAYHVWTQDWSVREAGGVHRLKVRLRGAKLTLALAPTKPLVKHGCDGRVDKGAGHHGFHYSFTRMRASGRLALNGSEREVHGTAWMDREAGDWLLNEEFQGWDWFAIQLDRDREVMVALVHDHRGGRSRISFVTLVDSENRVVRCSADQFSLASHDTWRSPHTGVVYPSGWTLQVPGAELELHIQPELRCQELDTRGSTMAIYWEGVASVRGSWRGQAAAGHAYVELFGYDRTHVGVSLIDLVRGERLRQKHGEGRILRETP